MTAWATVEHPETGEKLEVKAYTWGATRGRRDHGGAPLEPDEEAGLEICQVWDSTGRVIDYTEFEDELTEAVLAKLNER